MIDTLEAAFTRAQRLSHDCPRASIDPAIGNLMATRAIEHERVRGLADVLWSQTAGAPAGGGWRLWVFRQCTWLEPVYAWFTEGFQASDLLEARGLLDELDGSSHTLDFRSVG